MDYLTPMFVFEGHDEFLGLIPRTILIQHYVSLRILLKQLVVQVYLKLFHLLHIDVVYRTDLLYIMGIYNMQNQVYIVHCELTVYHVS